MPQALRNTELSMPAGPHKITRQLREVFREAFDQLGGAQWLVDFASKNDANARVFVQAMSKLLPASVPAGEKGKVIIDIPWLTKDRLAYKQADKGPMDEDIIDVLPKIENADTELLS